MVNASLLVVAFTTKLAVTVTFICSSSNNTGVPLSVTRTLKVKLPVAGGVHVNTPLVALIAGIAGLGLIFFLPIAGFVLLLTAIVTGIVARNSTEDPKSRKNALIGLVLGLVGIGLVIIALIAWAAVGVY